MTFISSLTVALKAKEKIEQNYTNPDFSVRELAGLMEFHEVYIRKVFAKHIQKSPNAVIKEVRMLKARELMQAGSTVQAAADAVGIPDASYFCKCYKKFFGYPPSKENLQEK